MKTLKTILAITIFIIFLTSCGSRGDGHADFWESYQNAPLDDMVENHKVVEIDGCEYIVYDYSRGYGAVGFMAHKGNCKNPIHKH